MSNILAAIIILSLSIMYFLSLSTIILLKVYPFFKRSKKVIDELEAELKIIERYSKGDESSYKGEEVTVTLSNYRDVINGTYMGQEEGMIILKQDVEEGEKIMSTLIPKSSIEEISHVDEKEE